MSPDLSTFSILGFGFLLGLWHAKDPDHLAAVSTIVAEKRSLFSSTVIGGFWGLGHTLALLAVGALVIFLKLQISERIEAWLEALVGFMLAVDRPLDMARTAVNVAGDATAAIIVARLEGEKNILGQH